MDSFVGQLWTETSREELYDLVSTYGVNAAVVILLSAITVFRREISCNRSYHEVEDVVGGDGEKEGGEGRVIKTSGQADSSNRRNHITPNSPSRTLLPSMTEEYEQRAEELLDGAGMFCSGTPILKLASQWVEGFQDDGGDCNAAFRSAADFSPTADDLLERASSYASGELLLAAMALWTLSSANKAARSSKAPLVMERPEWIGVTSALLKSIPQDVHVQICSYLPPKDVVSLSCVSKTYRNIIDDPCNPTSPAIWKTLWNRDYAWIIHEWQIGIMAYARSNSTTWTHSKDFYFRFSEAHLNYVIAGMNTYQHCYVGLHGNIYNITPFLFAHPGSPDTLMVHAGRDATAFFEDMGHSMGARRLALSLCVVTNKAANANNGDDHNNSKKKNDYGHHWGLAPTQHTELMQRQSVGEEDTKKIVTAAARKDDGEDRPPIPAKVEDGGQNLLLGRRQLRNSLGTLSRIRTTMTAERDDVRSRAARQYGSDPSVLGHEAHVYYDPFNAEWRLWYTDRDLQTIFVATT